MNAPRPWRRIFIPTDFSECSDQALALAGWLSQQHGATLTMLHTAEVPSGLSLNAMVRPAGHIEPLSIERYLGDPARERMQEQAKRVLGRQPDATRIAFGPAATTIVQVAAQEQADLLVLGTHGRTGLKHLLLGSVAERVVRLATCPVLVTRLPGHESDDAVRTREEEDVLDEAQGLHAQPARGS